MVHRAEKGTAVELTRSFSFIGGMGPGGTATGSTDYATSDKVGSALAAAVFTSPTIVQFTRNTSAGNTDWTAFVVQLTP